MHHQIIPLLKGVKIFLYIIFLHIFATILFFRSIKRNHKIIHPIQLSQDAFVQIYNDKNCNKIYSKKHWIAAFDESVSVYTMSIPSFYDATTIFFENGRFGIPRSWCLIDESSIPSLRFFFPYGDYTIENVKESIATIKSFGEILCEGGSTIYDKNTMYIRYAPNIIICCLPSQKYEKEIETTIQKLLQKENFNEKQGCQIDIKMIAEKKIVVSPLKKEKIHELF